MPNAGSASVERLAQGAVLLGACVLASGCGDGLGRPIVAELAVTGGAGAVSQSTGGATGLSSQTSTGGSGSGGATAFISPLVYCNTTLNWPAEQATAEDNLLVALNALRQAGKISCGGTALAAPALLNSEPLRCSSRLNSLSMLQSGFLTSISGDLAATRIALVGYAANRFAEVITSSEPANVDVAALLNRLLTGGGTDCANLLDPSFTSVGIGFAASVAQGFWTIDLASP